MDETNAYDTLIAELLDEGGPTVPATAKIRARLAAMAAALEHPALTLVGSPGGNEPPTVRPMSARTVLLAAAERAERAPAATGRYWHNVVQDELLTRVGRPGATYWVTQRQVNGEWTARDPEGSTWSLTQDLGAVLATPSDEAVWRREGAPEVFTQHASARARGRNPSLPDRKIPSAAGPREVTKGGPAGEVPFVLGRDLSMKEILALPADPAKLRRAITRDLGRHASDGKVFEHAANLILHYPVTPGVRAAAFRMLAGLDGVRLTGDATDARGRRGQAVALNVASSADLVHEWRLIFDPATGRALGSQAYVVRGTPSGLRPGARTNATTVLESGWTDTPPKS